MKGQLKGRSLLISSALKIGCPSFDRYTKHLKSKEVKKMQIALRNDGREIKSHGDFSFPVLVSLERLNAYEMGSFACHWHPELEFTLVLEGGMLYQINDRSFHLKAGDGIFCNSNMLHTGRHAQETDCVYLSVTVNPALLYGYEASLLQTKYIKPVTENLLFTSVLFSSDDEWGRTVTSHLSDIWELYQNPPRSYELRLLTELYQIWILLYDHLDLNARPSSGDIREQERLRRIITFIHDHYMEHISLDDISGCVNMCKSECCRLFRRNMNQPLFEYLLHYRIRQSIPLLSRGKDSITDISLQCGFSSPSYYTKLFRKFMGCTPREYKNKESVPKA